MTCSEGIHKCRIVCKRVPLLARLLSALAFSLLFILPVSAFVTLGPPTISTTAATGLSFSQLIAQQKET